MTAEHWQTESGAFEKIQGMDAIALHQGGTAIAKDVTLKDGTIEFDVQPMVMGTGMVFRREDEKTFEMFYFRPNGKCAEGAGLFAVCAGDAQHFVVGCFSAVSGAGADS